MRTLQDPVQQSETVIVVRGLVPGGVAHQVKKNTLCLYQPPVPRVHILVKDNTMICYPNFCSNILAMSSFSLWWTQDGRILPGDRIMYVNSSQLQHASLDTAVQVKLMDENSSHFGAFQMLPLCFYCWKVLNVVSFRIDMCCLLIVYIKNIFVRL